MKLRTRRIPTLIEAHPRVHTRALHIYWDMYGRWLDLFIHLVFCHHSGNVGNCMAAVCDSFHPPGEHGKWKIWSMLLFCSVFCHFAQRLCAPVLCGGSAAPQGHTCLCLASFCRSTRRLCSSLLLEWQLVVIKYTSVAQWYDHTHTSRCYFIDA